MLGADSSATSSAGFTTLAACAFEAGCAAPLKLEPARSINGNVESWQCWQCELLPCLSATIGSTRVARRRGDVAGQRGNDDQHRRCHDIAEGSPGVTRNSIFDIRPESANAPISPITTPMSASFMPSVRTIEHVAAPCADRHPHADFLRALVHRVRNHSIQPDRRQKHGDPANDARSSSEKRRSATESVTTVASGVKPNTGSPGSTALTTWRASGQLGRVAVSPGHDPDRAERDPA